MYLYIYIYMYILYHPMLISIIRPSQSRYSCPSPRSATAPHGAPIAAPPACDVGRRDGTRWDPMGPWDLCLMDG